MNAYELADLIGMCGDGGYNQDAANMLRQQADRIAELEKVSKPVAWIDYLEHSDLYDLNVSGRGIPLYTAPQIKELSDEEIDLKWWISSFEHLKALGGGISDEMETKLKEMKERLKKASEK